MRLGLGALVIMTSMLTVSAKPGSSCSAPLRSGKSASDDAFWMENIKHQGISAYHSDPNYQVFRNVKVSDLLFRGRTYQCVSVE